MTTSIAIVGCVLLGLATGFSRVPLGCNDDSRLTPSDNVLAGTNTPVYFFRTDYNYLFGYNLVRQRHAMFNLKKESTLFDKSSNGRMDINNKCPKSKELSQERTFPMNGTAPSTIYPKIVVIVDNGIYRRYENESNKLTKLLEHVLAVWNTVDLNFRTLENPKMRLNIAGIIVEEHPDGLPFLFHTNRDRSLNFEATIISLSRFMKSVNIFWPPEFGHYHILTVMTSMKIYSHDLQRGGKVGGSYDFLCQRNIIGPQQRLLFADDGDWLKLRTLSESLAESFHSSVSDRNGVNCPLNESAVMTYYSDETMDLPDWSNCFLDSFKMRFNNKEAECLFEKPQVISPLPRVLPGQIMGCDDQCRIREGKTCCVYIKPDASVCEDLLCEYDNVACSSTRIYAADGSPCGDGAICFRRKCVYKKDIE